MVLRSIPLVPALALGLAACSQAPTQPGEDVVHAIDPYLARALNDPLMVDPDLAYRNEANAAITIGHDHALPSLRASEEDAARAREVARLELLEDGPIPDLPLAAPEPGPASLAGQYGVEAVLDTLDLPRACRKQISGNFAYAASLPDHAALMPHGMVRVAAAVDQPGCTLRLVRYVTPVAIGDALQYHFTRAARAGMKPAYHTAPEAMLVAERRGTQIRVHARASAGNLTAVDVVTWTAR